MASHNAPNARWVNPMSLRAQASYNLGAGDAVAAGPGARMLSLTPHTHPTMELPT